MTPYLKITKAKEDRRLAQVVEQLPCKLKTLSSNPSTERREGGMDEGREGGKEGRKGGREGGKERSFFIPLHTLW
jgi:hypothetical protein